MEGVADPALCLAWLTGRSVARGLPPPVADRGGFRVDVGTADKICRWVFTDLNDDLIALSNAIDEPRLFIRCFCSCDDLRAVLPARWDVGAPTSFMRAGPPMPQRPLPPGYAIEVERLGAAVAVRIRAPDGGLAASGYGGEAGESFVYDRIVSDPAHRRRGLGGAVMATLQASQSRDGLQELLVATEEGRALYERLGWEPVSGYASAVIPGRS